MLRKLLFILALAAASCGRKPCPTPTLAACIESIDSADGTGACDCLPLVDARDGIDQLEARAIAKVWFAGFGGEWGGIGTMYRHGDDWTTWKDPPPTGTGVPRGELLRVDARTGAVTAGRDSFPSLQVLRASVGRLSGCDGRADLKELAAERRGCRL